MMDAETKTKLWDAHSSLFVALSQSIPADDQVMMDRVREAMLVLDDVLDTNRGAEMLVKKAKPR